MNTVTLKTKWNETIFRGPPYLPPGVLLNLTYEEKRKGKRRKQ